MAEDLDLPQLRPGPRQEQQSLSSSPKQGAALEKLEGVQSVCVAFLPGVGPWVAFSVQQKSYIPALWKFYLHPMLGKFLEKTVFLYYSKKENRAMVSF